MCNKTSKLKKVLFLFALYTNAFDQRRYTSFYFILFYFIYLFYFYFYFYLSLFFSLGGCNFGVFFSKFRSSSSKSKVFPEN